MYLYNMIKPSVRVSFANFSQLSEKISGKKPPEMKSRARGPI